jgi:hypothetical protein
VELGPNGDGQGETDSAANSKYPEPPIGHSTESAMLYLILKAGCLVS